MARYYTEVINLDWLSYSGRLVMTDIERATFAQMNAPANCSIKEFPGTNIFKKRHIVYNEGGDKLATLLTYPYSRIVHGETLFIEIANKWLYVGFEPIRQFLQQCHEHTFANLSRIDICADFNPTPEQVQIIDGLQAGTAYVQGKREGSMFHTYTQQKRVGRAPKCMSWGSPATQIKFKLYNKTLEIHPTDPNGRVWCSKPYIESQWVLNGLDPRNVWRLEVSINNASTLEWRGQHLTWDTIADPATYTSLFYDLVATRFVIRANEGHENKRYDKILPFLHIPTDDHSRVHKAAPEDARKHTDHVATIRALVKELDRPEVQANARVALPLIDTLAQIVKATHLEAYLSAVVGKPLDDYFTDYLDKM